MTAQPLQLRDALTDAMRYWEPRRIAYNLVLAAVVLAHAIFSWLNERLVVSTDRLLALFVLAVLANVAYCAAYVADLPAQFSAFRSTWQRWRFAIFIVGVMFAGVIAHFFSRGLFAAVI